MEDDEDMWRMLRTTYIGESKRRRGGYRKECRGHVEDVSSIGECRGYEKVSLEDVEDITILHINTVLNSCG